MKVRELFAELNLAVQPYRIYLRDINSKTTRSDDLKSFLNNKDLYIDWKNAYVWAWAIVENEFIVTVQKGV